MPVYFGWRGYLLDGAGIYDCIPWLERVFISVYLSWSGYLFDGAGIYRCILCMEREFMGVYKQRIPLIVAQTTVIKKRRGLRNE